MVKRKTKFITVMHLNKYFLFYTDQMIEGFRLQEDSSQLQVKVSGQWGRVCPHTSETENLNIVNVVCNSTGRGYVV